MSGSIKIKSFVGTNPTGEPITDTKRVAEIWVKGEPLVRHYGSPESAFEALAKLEKEGQSTRVFYAQDRQSGIKLLGDKAWYVRSVDGVLNAFLLKEAAEGWAKTQGGAVLDFASARNAILASR